MKIYVIEFDMSLVLPRLKRFNLGTFNCTYPMIFIDADNPDDACYLAYCKFSETLLKQDESTETALFIKDIMHDMRIRKAYCKDEKKL